MKRFGILSLAMLVGLMAGLTPLTSLWGQEEAGTAPLPAAGAHAGASRGAGGSPALAAPPEGGSPAPSRGSRGGGSFGGSTAGAAASTLPTSVAEGPTCSIDATVYQVSLVADQIAHVDMDKLNKAAASLDAFEKALGELGTTHPLYHINQTVRLGGDRIQMTASTPYITNSQITNTGQTINSVSYTNVGAIFNIVGKTLGSNLDVDLGIQVSGLTDGGVKISTNVAAPYFRVTQMSRKGLVKPNQPFVVLSADAASTDTAGKAVAYVTRVVMGAPQASTATLP